MRQIRKRNISLSLPTLKLEGGLFLPDMLEKAALGLAKFQTEADYGIPKGLKTKDEFSRSFLIASAQWKHFEQKMERKDIDPYQATVVFVTELLKDALGYPVITAISEIQVTDRSYPIKYKATGVGSLEIPIVITPHQLSLDDSDNRFAIKNLLGETTGNRKKTPFQLGQEFLNSSDHHQWAIVSNGKTLRLIRDASTLTRPSFLEFDIQDILSGQRYSEFAYIWRLLHASRAGLVNLLEENNKPQVIWEIWREAGQEEGTRVRDGLRLGVEQALIILGNGFILHPNNDSLRQALSEGRLTPDQYFSQLLRLIYRLIFVFSIEERGFLRNDPSSQDDQITSQLKLNASNTYAEGYSLARFRDLSLRRRAMNRFNDLWQSVKIVFRGLESGEPKLGLPALGGLFTFSQCQDIDSADLYNSDLLAAMKNLRWTTQNGRNLSPIDYRNMGVEELGSVYESLLELVPEIDLPAKKFGFVGIDSEGTNAGNQRKLTGSYYTPDSLVQELIKSALEPVIEKKLNDNPNNPIQALLSLSVIDPACGSGHFLLAAARKIAERLAQFQSNDGVVTPQSYRHALREVISNCIFGVDRNPMAIELARTALWLESYEENKPLSFLDHHLQCGDALLGLMDLRTIYKGIPKEAFKALSGDIAEVCTELARKNRQELNQFDKDFQRGQTLMKFDDLLGVEMIRQVEQMPANTPEEILKKEKVYLEFLSNARNSKISRAANILIGSFLLPKNESNKLLIPTSSTLYLEMMSETHNDLHSQQLRLALEVCSNLQVFHWQIAFPQIFASGGFDCVLANPPWERIKLQEEEFFASRHPKIAEARNKSERTKLIKLLSEGKLDKFLNPDIRDSTLIASIESEKRLYLEFTIAKRTAEASSIFFHVDESSGGRYPLTGVGDVNTYALFAETFLNITKKLSSDRSISNIGRAGFIVPTGIATDDSTKAFFGYISQNKILVSLYDIENREKLFPAVDSRMKFSLLTLGYCEKSEFVFFATNTNQLSDVRRRFTLTPEEFNLINPNTLTCPLFRSKKDAELTKKIYSNAPVLVNDSIENGNPWGISFMSMFHMSSDSNLFLNQSSENSLPLYEAKLIHHYDHRWATYLESGDSREVTLLEKQDSNFCLTPRYWIMRSQVDERLASKNWNKNWLLGWRNITNTTNERSFISAVFPKAGVGHSMPLYFLSTNLVLYPSFIALTTSLVFDYLIRQKLGGTNMTLGYLKQIPVISPNDFKDIDINFITSRVLELTYTTEDLKDWASDIGFKGGPFNFDSENRHNIKSELDAYIAKKIGLSKDDLSYILDPISVLGEGYPSVTFPGLKRKEISEFGEYRTQRLVLEAWDKLESGELH